MDIEQYAIRHIHYRDDSFKNRELKLLLDNGGFRNLIDVGCGDGTLLYQLNHAGYLQNMDAIWAVDLSKQRLQNVKGIFNAINAIQSNAQYLEEVPSAYFDIVISTQVIEHVEDDFEMLNSLYRIALPGAFVYLDTVFRKRHGYYFYINRRGEHVLDPTHLREYTDTADLISKSMAAGFHVLHSVMVPFRFSPLNTVLRFLRFTNGQVGKRPFLKNIQKIRIPIPGYRCWKLILRKPLSV